MNIIEEAKQKSKLEGIQRQYLPAMIMGNPADFDATWDIYVAEM